MIGPLAREVVADMLARGEIFEDDLAQRDGIDVWIPLSRLFPPPPPPTRLERASQIARESGLKFWTALHINPLRTGLASLLAGCALIIFPRWTFLLFVPALAAAVFAGAILLTRRQFIAGAFLSASGVILPALFLLAGSDDPRFAGRLSHLPSPFIDPVIATPAPAIFPPKPTPLAHHAGIALPQPVKPTPTPRPVPPI